MSYRTWPPETNYESPVKSIANRFQRDLIRIAGTAPGGKPMLRIVWGQETTEFIGGSQALRYLYSTRYYERGWIVRDPAGDKWFPNQPTEAENPNRYFQYHLEPRKEEIGVSRYMLEQWYPWQDGDIQEWEDNRYWYDPETGIKHDISGPPDPWGQYNVGFHSITEHRDGCCLRAKERRQRCYGEYRDPAQIDLDYAAALWQMQLAQPMLTHWTEAAPRHVIERRRLEAITAKAEADEKRSEERRQQLYESFKLARKRLFDPGHGPDFDLITDYGAARIKAAKNQKENHVSTTE